MTTTKKATAHDVAALDMVDLASYDYIVVSTSAGKDSQAALDVIAELATEAGIMDRVVCCHADLGRMEWAGTLELVHEHAAHYGFPVHVVSRIGQPAKGARWTVSSRSGGAMVDGIDMYAPGEPCGDILDQSERRGLQLRSQGKLAAGWNSPGAPWCQSDHKIAPICSLFTALAKSWRAERLAELKATNPKAKLGQVRACRILDVQGIRADESDARAARPAFQARKATSSQVVDSWLPIHGWGEQETEDYCRSDSPLRLHWAYNEGMPRLSCCFCMYASYDAMLIAGHHNPELLADFARVEAVLGTRYVQNLEDKTTGRSYLSMSDVEADLAAGRAIPTKAAGWVCPAA